MQNLLIGDDIQFDDLTYSQYSMLPSSKQAVVDRLKKRFNIYRNRQNDYAPRSDQALNSEYELQSLETKALQKKFIEGKTTKGGARRADKKSNSSAQQRSQQQPQPQQKFTQAKPDEKENRKKSEDSGPSLKIPLPTNDNMTKISVEIVQKLEFSRIGNSQPQQISSNVTVKTTTNQSESHSDKNANKNQEKQQKSREQNFFNDIFSFKQEPESDFADLDECAAALEKDVDLSGLSDLLGGNSDAFNDFISDFDINSDFLPFEDETLANIKQEKMDVPEYGNYMMSNQQNNLNVPQTNSSNSREQKLFQNVMQNDHNNSRQPGVPHNFRQKPTMEQKFFQNKNIQFTKSLQDYQRGLSVPNKLAGFQQMVSSEQMSVQSTSPQLVRLMPQQNHISQFTNNFANSSKDVKPHQFCFNQLSGGGGGPSQQFYVVKQNPQEHQIFQQNQHFPSNQFQQFSNQQSAGNFTTSSSMYLHNNNLHVSNQGVPNQQVNMNFSQGQPNFMGSSNLTSIKLEPQQTNRGPGNHHYMPSMNFE